MEGGTLRRGLPGDLKGFGAAPPPLGPSDQAVIGAYDQLLVNSDDQRPTVGADGGIDDGQVDCGRGEGGNGPLKSYGALDDVAGGDGVRDIDQARGR